MEFNKEKLVVLLGLVFTVMIFISNVYQQSESGSTNVVLEERPEDALLEVHYLDVGQGDGSLIIDNVTDTVILIDAGQRENADHVLDVLDELGIDEIDYVVGTHPHSDHIGGLIKVLETVPVKNVVMPEVEHTTKTYEDFITATMNNKGNPNVIYAYSGMNTKIGDMEIEIFAPEHIDKDELNNDSIVFRMDYLDYSFLFTGDAEEEIEEEILNSKFDVNVDFYKAGHHGSSTSNSEEYVRAVSPEVTVIQLGADNDYGHPHKEALEILEKYTTKEIYRNDLDGDISMYFNEDGYIVETSK